MPKILKYVQPGVRIVPQSEYVAGSLQSYLQRHPSIENKITKNGRCQYFTTENSDKFKDSARIFLHEDINVRHIDLE
jgi:glutamate racemase